jgi:hypothetical protein
VPLANSPEPNVNHLGSWNRAFVREKISYSKQMTSTLVRESLLTSMNHLFVADSHTPRKAKKVQAISTAVVTSLLITPAASSNVFTKFLFSMESTQFYPSISSSELPKDMESRYNRTTATIASSRMQPSRTNSKLTTRPSIWLALVQITKMALQRFPFESLPRRHGL